MAIIVPKLTLNLKNLRAVRRAILINADDPMRASVQAPVVVLESQVAGVVDDVLNYLKVARSADSTSDPILIVSTRLLEVTRTPAEMVFVGTSLVVQEQVLLTRTLTWWDRLRGRTTNAPADVWSTTSTASVVPETTVGPRLVKDVGRLLDAFARDWRIANA